MGDVCDMSDIDRFMRSPEGQARLEEIQRSLVGRTIIIVEFLNETHTIGIELTLDNKCTFECHQPELDVDTLRDEFAKVLEREYYADYPERQP